MSSLRCLNLILCFVSDIPGLDMSFIFDWIYSGFSSMLQFLGKFTFQSKTGFTLVA